MREDPGGAPVVEVAGLGVRYEVDAERIGSFKEHVLHRMLRGRTTEALWALRGVDLEVRPGEVFGVFGRNGAGKSTLLRVLARSLAPTEGRVRLRGRAAPLLAIGAGFHSDMTAAENVLLNASLLGRTVREARDLFPAIVEFAELGDRMHLPLRQMSSGMIARLGFSVATALRPDLLLVDEVLAVGDAGFQEKCLARIGGFRDAGTAIVLVSHQARALDWCDRGVLLEAGRVVAAGRPARLERELNSRFGPTHRRSPPVRGGVDRLPAAAPPSSAPAAEEGGPPPTVAEPQRPEEEGAAVDRRLARELVRRAADERSAAIALRLFAEAREQARKHGFELRRVHQLGPGALPATLACFRACGAESTSSSGSVSRQTLDVGSAGTLLDLLRIVGGAGWWRTGVDDPGDLPMVAPTAFPGLDPEALVSGVRLGVSADEERPTFVFSFGALGHVSDPARLLKELAEALPPGAGMAHEIALAHLFFADPLAHLELSEAEAARIRAERTEADLLPEVPPEVRPAEVYCNRWLASDWLQGHEEAGFAVLATEPLALLDADRVRPERLASPYRDRPLDDLRTLVVRVVSRRRRR